MPYDKFPTKTCEVFLGIGNNGQWKKLCEFLGHPELAEDPRFVTNAERFRHRPQLRTLLEGHLQQVDGEELCRNLLAAGIPAGAHTLHRKMVVEVEGKRAIGIPIKLSRTPGQALSAPPRFGQHTRALLAEYGFDAAAIDALLAQGTVLEGSPR